MFRYEKKFTFCSADFVVCNAAQISLFARLFLLKGMTGLNIGQFIVQVYLKQICIAALAFLPSWWLTSLIGQTGLLKVIASGTVAVVITLGLIYVAGLDSDERKVVLSRIKAFLNRGLHGITYIKD